MARRRGWFARVGVVTFAALAASVIIFSVIVDVVLALLGGVLIGIALGYFLIPWAVDKFDGFERAAIRRRRRG